MDPYAMPFTNGRRAKRRLKIEVDSACVTDAVKGLAGNSDDLPRDAKCIHGVLDISVGFAYSHLVQLQPLDRAQHFFWQSMGVPPNEQWFFKIKSVESLPKPVPADEYISKRFSKVYTYINQDSMEELCGMFEILPIWLASEAAGSDMRDSLHLAAMIPQAFVKLCMHRLLEFLVLPSPMSPGWWKASRWFIRNIDPAVVAAFRASRDELPQEPFGLQMCGLLADDLRKCLDLLGRGCAVSSDILASWVCRLQEREDQLHVRSSSDRLAAFVQMIELIMLAEKLRNSEELGAVMRRVLQLTLPQDLKSLAESALKKFPKLGKSKISRGHLTLDVGFMLHQRVSNWMSGDAARYLMWDSSPQFGRDYQMCLVQQIRESDLDNLWDCSEAMFFLWESEGPPNFSDSNNVEDEAAIMAKLRNGMKVHALPAVLIGFGSAGFKNKLHALLHAARLEVFSEKELAQWTSSIVTVASGYGAERLLANLHNVSASDVAGWFEDVSLQDIRLCAGAAGASIGAGADALAQFPDAGVADFDFQDPAAAPQLVNVAIGDEGNGDDEEEWELANPTRLTFENLLGIPGLHHIIDNATKGLKDVMDSYTDNIFLAEKVCRFLYKPSTRIKLIERCFVRGPGVAFADDIKKFKGWINTGRWGTVAFSVPELLKVKHAIVWGWDETQFLRGEPVDGDIELEEKRRETAELAAYVSQAVQSPAWWGWIAMFEVVCGLLRQHIRWAESCPCHDHLLQTHREDLQTEPDLLKQFLSCPMRGLRAPELSAGQFLDLLSSLWQVSAAEVLRVLPAAMEERDRKAIMQEFDRARAHVAFYFTVKLSHLQELPWKILQLGHRNEVVAQMAANDILSSASPHPHPFVQKLCQPGPLRQACQRWIGGESLSAGNMKELRKFVATMRFVPTSERAIEGQHAKVHRQGLGRPNHTEHFQSYFVRSNEMAQALENGDLSLESFAWYCQIARNSFEACQSVGLAGHPSLGTVPARRRHQSQLHAKVIYHADPYTLYTAAAPDVEMKPGGGRNVVPLHALQDDQQAANPRAAGDG